MPLRTIILSIIGLIALTGISIGGYFLFIEVEEVHKQNVANLAGFGSKVVPSSPHNDNGNVTYGVVDGVMQLPPSIQERKLSPTEKVILSLSRDKDLLQIEVVETTEILKQQQARLEELRAYKAENQRFAPERLLQERQDAEALLKKHLDNTVDIDRFNDFQRKAMILATANLYTDIVRQHQLIMDDKFKEELLTTILPQFGLCLGKGLPFMTNSRSEESILIKALSANNQIQIEGGLGDDFNATHGPCLKRANRDLNLRLASQSNRVIAPSTNSDNLTSDQASSNTPAKPIIDSALSPTEQLIQHLNHDKAIILNKASLLREQLNQQIQELAELKSYHDGTERFAPLPTLEERNRAQGLLLDYMQKSRDAKRFNSFEKLAMSYAAANYYAHFSTRQRLVLTEAIKDQIIQTTLPNFGFCYGDGLKIIIDNHQQERQLIKALQEQDSEYIDASLAQQIAPITKACEEQLDQQLSAFY